MPESKQRFPNDANKIYTYKDADTLLDNIEDLKDIVEHHISTQVPRLDVLDNYYLGNNTTILTGERRKEKNDADHRATHNYGKYVSQFIVGYLTGVPIEVSHYDETIQQSITDINDLNEADALNSELTLDCSVYGRAYELVYRNTDKQAKFTLLSPLETFVIYDDTVEQKPIAGIRHRSITEDDTEKLIIEVYTHNRVLTLKMDKTSKEHEQMSDESHYFDDVPINEYANNRFRQGDFENVLDLIDLYDSAQSDLANYSQDLQDALLKIVGDVDLDIDGADRMREGSIILLIPNKDAEGRSGNVDADYIYKQYDVQGMEAYKNRIDNDIHKFTSIPNMEDERFASAQSGESLKYRLFALEQKRATKERHFKRAMRNRYKLINNIMASASEVAADAFSDIKIDFTPNFPKNTKEQVDIFNSLGGRVSNETLLSLLPYEIDVEEEQQRLADEDEQNRQASSYMDVDS